MQIDFLLPGVEIEEHTLKNQSTYPIYVPSSPIAKKLVSYKQLKLDLDIARASFLNINQLADCEENYFLKHSLWFSGVITYARCFKSSTGRTVLKEKDYIKPLAPEFQTAHKEIIQQRDEYIAHAGGSHYEQIYIFTVLNPDIANKAILGLTNIYDRIFCVNEHTAKTYAGLAEKIIEKVAFEEEKVTSAFISYLESLNLDEVYNEALLPEK